MTFQLRAPFYLPFRFFHATMCEKRRLKSKTFTLVVVSLPDVCFVSPLPSVCVGFLKAKHRLAPTESAVFNWRQQKLVHDGRRLAPMSSTSDVTGDGHSSGGWSPELAAVN